MKLNKISKYVAVAFAIGSLAGVTSCNYLDVVPPEQPTLKDAMKTHNAALGFLHSCYAGTTDVNIAPSEHHTIMAATDEYVLPNEQESAYPTPFSYLKNTQTTNGTNCHWLWGSMYQYIGQCLLFEEQLKTVGREYEVTDNADQEKEWLAETRFLKAFYHYMLLRVYGPVPLTLERIPMDSPSSDFPGRSHFDYCVSYLAGEFDAAAADLPATRTSSECGRATSVIAKAMKARMLLDAASDLWNGKFPYPEWRNVNYETPGYGRELVSNTYDRQKWIKAYQATKEAIKVAEDAGHALKYDYEMGNNLSLNQLDWLPVDFTDDTEKEAFQDKVMLNRYIHCTSPSNNTEIIWALNTEIGYLCSARLPLKIIKNSNNQWYSYGYSVFNTTLNVAYNFLCNDGKLPAQTHTSTFNFPNTRSEWFKRYNENDNTGHKDIIRLMSNREPRFYAWIAFDGGDYLNALKSVGGTRESLILDFKSNKAQGADFANEPKNLASTGLLSMKHINPGIYVDNNLNLQEAGGSNRTPRVMCRLAELYLNLAECAAELVNEKRAGYGTGLESLGVTSEDLKKEAIRYINIVRDRAGAKLLSNEDIDATYINPVSNESKTMTLVEWVRQERFIELYDEGMRYYDVRRWVAGPEYFGAGRRVGLSGNIENPTFEEFNTPRNINPTFSFSNRQYLYPLFINEVYKNPQMIQAPGF